MKKNVIALLLAIVMVSGNVGTVPALAAEAITQEAVAVEEKTVEDAEEEPAETEDAGTGEVGEDTAETESVNETEEVPEQELTENIETTKDAEEADTTEVDEVSEETEMSEETEVADEAGTMEEDTAEDTEDEDSAVLGDTAADMAVEEEPDAITGEGTTEVEAKEAALAEGDIVASGTCGDNATWTLTGTDNDLTLTISGSGAMYNYTSSGDSVSPWYSNSTIKKIIIEDGITSIGDWAFNEFSNLQEIIIANSVTIIGDGTFDECTSLKSIDLPDSITSIGAGAFEKSGVETFTIPSRVTEISECLFYGSSIKTIKIHNGVTSIGNLAFYWSALESIDIPNTVVSIGESAFSWTKIESIKLPNNLDKINSSMFLRCGALKSIIIPESVTKIEDSAFYDCSSLADVYFTGSREKWDSVEIVQNGNNVLFNLDIQYEYHVVTEIDPIIELSSDSFVYNGEPQKPDIIVKDGDSIVDPSNYDVTYSGEGINAGVYEVTVNLKNDYIGTASSEYQIIAKSIVPTISLSRRQFIYNGKVQKPTVTVKDGEYVLKQSDYVVDCVEETIEPGTYTISVVLQGNYAGTAMTDFTIISRDYTTDKYLLLKNYILEKGGTNNSGEKLLTERATVEGVSYVASIIYLPNEEAFDLYYISEGQEIVNLKISEYGLEDIINANFISSSMYIQAIAPINASSFSKTSSVYFTQKSAFIHTDDQIQEVCNDYLRLAFISWDILLMNNLKFDVNMGDLGFESYEAHGLHTWENSYTVDKEPTYAEEGSESIHCSVCDVIKEGSQRPIAKLRKPVSMLTISGITAKTYNGKAQTQAVVLKDGTTTLKNGTHYTLTYKNNTNAGTASVVITGKGNYTGSVTKTFTINKAANAITAGNFTKAYSTKAQSFSLGAKAKGGTLTYASNSKSVTVTKAGKVTIKAKFIGNAAITITAQNANYNQAIKRITITVNPNKTALSSAKNSASKKMTVKWKKNTSGKGYQIQYSTSKNFKGAKTVTIKKNKIVTKTIGGLKKGKKYYVRVRTYKAVGKLKFYSGWSTVKKVAIKK